MTQSSGVRAEVLAAREFLAEGRRQLQARHDDGSPGIHVCVAAAELVDQVVLKLFQLALRDLAPADAESFEQQVALIAHAGYGRREMAPYSDVDLMLLYAGGAGSKIEPVARRLLGDLFDTGLQLGQSVRTPRQAVQAAMEDAVTLTSLSEQRFLAGSEALYRSFSASFAKAARRRRKNLLVAVEAERTAERNQYGETVYLLEPNVKRSRGGLRDVQLIRWVGFLFHGVTDPEDLLLRGALSKRDFRALREATAFLLRLRNEMHFHAGQAHDQLDRAEQMRLAERWGFAGREGMMPVEEFMQDYFRHTTAVSELATRFANRCGAGGNWLRLLEPLFSHEVEGDYRVGRQVRATRRGLEKLTTDICEVLRLADLAAMYNAEISVATSDAIREAAAQFSDDLPEDAARRFLSLLGQPQRLGELLRLLHEMRVLEKIVPAMQHARCLLQFNEYHLFTVDEHSLRAVEAATALQAQQGPLALAYRRIERKDLLHLALLLHDLGKGYVEDHSDVGKRIARETGLRLRLSPHDVETVEFLVHKHLMMSHTAFRRDTSDDLAVLQFAHDVGSPERLQMLYVLTAADMTAVKPGVFNHWKADVLTSLYNRAMWHLAGDRTMLAPQERLEQLRQSVSAQLGEAAEDSWFVDQLAALPLAYYETHSPAEIAQELQRLRELPHSDVIAGGQFIPEREAVRYTVATHESLTPGIFHRLTGALSGQGLSILAAEIFTMAHGLIIDRFEVFDSEYEGPPPRERIESICQVLRESVLHPLDARPKFRTLWQERKGKRPSELAPLPNRVSVDNSTSRRCTVIDVFAHDRLGLLYTITRTLFELGLSVATAKIGTYLDQVVDVFYVTDNAGRKIEDPARMAAIRDRLLHEISELERNADTEPASALTRRV